MNLKKNVLHWEKWNFESIMNSVHATELLTLRKGLNKNIYYLMYYPNIQYVK